MKLRITSDGTPHGTTVRNAETGEIVQGIVSVTWRVAVGELATATIEWDLAAVDVTGETA